MTKICTPELQYEAGHRTKTFGTYLTACGTIVPGVAGRIIVVHHYSLSSSGTAAWSFNNAKPTGGTVHYGGYLASNVTYLADKHVSPYIPYPGYLCKTLQLGSALCLGTYAAGFGSGAGTLFVNVVYTDSDVS